MSRRVFAILRKPIPSGPTAAIRVLCGFLMAPFIAFLPFTVLAGDLKGVLSSLATSLLLFPATFVLGFPTYLFLRWRGLLRWYHFCIAGALAAVLSLVAVYLLSNWDWLLFLYGENRLHRVVLLGATSLPIAALVGGSIAFAFWALVHSRFHVLPEAEASASGRDAP